MAVTPCSVSDCPNPALVGSLPSFCAKHYADPSDTLDPPAPAPEADERNKIIWGVVISIVVVLLVWGTFFDNPPELSNDEAFVTCLVQVSINNTTNTADLAGIDRCNELYPKNGP